MDIAHYLRALRAHWLLVALLMLVGAGAAGLVSVLQTPQYRADVQLFISISDGNSGASDLYQGGSFAQERVRSYTNIVASPLVTSQVISDLHLPYTTDQLAKKIEASSPLNTVLLDVSVTDPSAQRARDIANALATDFTRFIETIETPTGSTTSPVKATVTKSASLPTTPVSPKTTLNVALGLLVGLALGATVAIMRDSLDKTIRGRREITAVTDEAIVGEVADDPKTKKRPLIIDEPTGSRAEAYRRLRTNIRFLSVDERIGSLVVTGSVPGEGKSTVAANLAIALAQAGEQVVLIDADLRMPTLATIFSLPGSVGLTSVLLGDVRIEAALQQWRRDLPLQIVTSGPIPPNPSELLGSRRLADLVASLVAANMTVIFDSPPLVPVTDAAVLARATQGALVVTRVGSTRSDELEASIESLRNVNARVLGVVANRVKRAKEKGGGYGGYYTGQRSRWHSGGQRAAAAARVLRRTADEAPAARQVLASPLLTTAPPSWPARTPVPRSDGKAGAPNAAGANPQADPQSPVAQVGMDDTQQVSLRELRERT